MLSVQDTSKSNELFGPPMRLTIHEAVTFLDRLAREPAFLVLLLPLLEQENEGWYVAHHRDALDASYSLQVFVWPPESRTRIHDHSSWGASRCVMGTIFEERYERLDDGSQQGHARLRKIWERAWREDDGTSTVLPLEGGIHRIVNLSLATNGDADPPEEHAYVAVLNPNGRPDALAVMEVDKEVRDRE